MAKWIIGAVALVAVITVTAVVAVSCTKSSGGSDKPTAAPTTSGAPTSDFASANDTGPVSVITEDPSCAPWLPIVNTLAGSQDNGWRQRDPAIPAELWSPELRNQYFAVADAMRQGADQAEPLAKLTTHRVMRQLYEQFIAYSRAYADSIPTYTQADDQLGVTAVTLGELLSNICQAINFGSASARAPLVPPAAGPSSVAPLGDPSNPAIFLRSVDPTCPDWQSTFDDYNSNSAVTTWLKTDPNLPVSQWNPEQKAATAEVIPVMTDLADRMSKLGSRSSNLTLQDFASLAVQYQRAYLQALPTYSKQDNYLYDAARFAPGVILGACKAAGTR
ncbi:hypothetical protein [Mycolicibacterium fluoranthenivorans]|nr:hypothetical protein [Mycolicibacterium fluoranthenivorans]